MGNASEFAGNFSSTFRSDSQGFFTAFLGCLSRLEVTSLRAQDDCKQKEMHMTRMRLLVAGGIAGALLAGGAGGALGAVLAGATSAAAIPVTLAASTSSTPSSGSTPSQNAPTGGTFKPNEDPTHEAGESAAREAQENAGQMPTVP
jgi:hypothetical protein